jgi:hypothetical protein
MNRYSTAMKLQSILILTAILLSIAVPPSLTVVINNDMHTSIVALDICHSSTPALSSNGDMPCVHAAPYLLMPSPVIAANINANHAVPLFILSLQDERPPKA